MKGVRDFELPESLRKVQKKAVTLERVTLIYLISVVVVMYLTMGSSQAMKSAWLEDVLSLLPSIAFLISSRINSKSPNKKFRYGYHRVFSIAFLSGAIGLLGMGLFLVFDSAMALIKGEHPTIGSILILGQQLWMGWIMLLALLYSAVPAMILGFKKLPLAKELHNKVLFTDAKAQKADYLTAFAAMVGVVGIGAGFWWLDAVAALFISFSVLKDGFTHTKTAILDLMDRYPVTLKKQQEDKLIAEIEQIVLSWDWVKQAEVRIREHGQVYFGEIAVIPENGVDLDQLEAGYKQLRDYHWKIHDLSIAPVKKLPGWDKE